LNAVVEERFTAAMEDAKKADKIVSETSKIYVIENYPLLGVPFTVKESIEVKGMSKESGSIPRKGMKASKDAEVVKKLKAAGGIPLLVSTTPEFCFSWECSNLVTGRTNNPYDLSRTSG
jgi:fatty acid amide hydrolase 2